MSVPQYKISFTHHITEAEHQPGMPHFDLRIQAQLLVQRGAILELPEADREGVIGRTYVSLRSAIYKELYAEVHELFARMTQLVLDESPNREVRAEVDMLHNKFNRLINGEVV